MASQNITTVDPSKKRKSDEIRGDSPPEIHPLLTPDVIRAILDPLTKDQLADIIQSAALRHPSVLDDIRSVADPELAKRKLYVRGLGLDTSSESLHSAFTSFGEIIEAVVVVDKATGKPRGFGFVVFRHVDSALLALQEPSKKIDGRMTYALMASAGNNGATTDTSSRKIYVRNIPSDVSAEALLAHFMAYGDIEEGPLGYDHHIGKPKRFAFFIYKTAEGARASLVDPFKTIGGQQVICKLADDGKMDKPNEVDVGIGFGNNYGLNRPSFQAPPFYGGGGCDGGFGGYGGPGPIYFGGRFSNVGPMYRPLGYVWMPSGGYQEGGSYGHVYGPGPRVPHPGRMYPGMPPYY